jgi:hypothetical protein
MVDLVITPANVIATGSAIKETGIAGVSILAGQTVYKEAATGLFKLADSNNATVEAQVPYGIALNPALTSQPVTVITSGDYAVGATLVAGSFYYQSETPGGIQPVADLAATEKVTAIGFATTTTNLTVRITPTGVTL